MIKHNLLFKFNVSQVLYEISFLIYTTLIFIVMNQGEKTNIFNILDRKRIWLTILKWKIYQLACYL